MSTPQQDLQKHRQFIYLMEIGALLHDVGKLWTDHLVISAKGVSARGRHQHQDVADIDANGCPVDPLMPQDYWKLLHRPFPSALGQGEATDAISMHDLIARHHRKRSDGEPVSQWMDLLTTESGGADSAASGDDKAVARAEQPYDDVWISTPFGFDREQIKWEAGAYPSVDAARKTFYETTEEHLRHLLSDAPDGWLRARRGVIEAAKEQFSRGLGETRRAANDVTLWDHAWACASLVKASVADALISGVLPTPVEDIHSQPWRLYGVAWQGSQFVMRGRKIADIQARLQAIRDMRIQLRAAIEETIPCGSLVYEDVDTAFFTFPALCERVEQLQGLAESVTDLVRAAFTEAGIGDELSPAVTLSKPSWTMTVIQRERQRAVDLASVPVQSVVVSVQTDILPGQVDDDLRQIGEWRSRPPVPPVHNTSTDGSEVCPSCHRRFVSRDTPKGLEALCGVCRGRRSDRAKTWWTNGVGDRTGRDGPTIWLDELKDKENRIALIWATFDLDRWLDGTRLYEQFAQTPMDWGKEPKLKGPERNALWEFLGGPPADRAGAHRLAQDAIEKSMGCPEAQDKDEDRGRPQPDPEFLALYSILPEHFQTVEVGLRRLRGRGPHTGSAPDASAYMNLAFKTHPSPARLGRVWRTTQRFLSDAHGAISEIAGEGEARTVLTVENAETHLSPGSSLDDLTVLLETDVDTFIVSGVSVYSPHDQPGKWVVVSGDHRGMLEAKYALVSGINESGAEFEEDVTCLQPDTRFRRHTPIVTDDPLLYQVLIPANKAWEAVQSIRRLYREQMSKVQGKLPLHIGVLIFKHRLPLYIVLETAETMRQGLKQRACETEWQVSGEPANGNPPAIRFTNGCEWPLALQTGRQGDPDYYHNWWRMPKDKIGDRVAFDPRADLSHEWSLCHATDLLKDDTIAVDPGYLDVSLLLGSAQRLDIGYRVDEGTGAVRRVERNARWPIPRPYYLEDIDLLCEARAALERIAPTQRKHIQHAIEERARAYAILPDDDAKSKALRGYALAVLVDAFGEQWASLTTRERQTLETCIDRRMLCDIIHLFTSVLKLAALGGSAGTQGS